MTLRHLLPAGFMALVAVLALLLQQAWIERGQARRDAKAASGFAEAARKQTALTGEAARATERAQSRELQITLKAKEATDEIKLLEGADSPVPDAVVAVWGDSVDRLRGTDTTARTASHSGG